jgi:cellulose biosynthesis protein BcsQ
MQTIGILNHKGGVGKTTFTGCCGQALALAGFRVLLIDNDSQHNLTSMMQLAPAGLTIRDIYRADTTRAPGVFLKSIIATEIDNLHIITAPARLSETDLHDTTILRSAIEKTQLERFYDFVLIDNAPGLDMLQSAAIRAADQLFVPTELKQFAVNGLTEMDRIISQTYPEGPRITKIIPNFFRNIKRHHTYLHALHRLFPDRLTDTAIPWDGVFDEIITEGKILFLHRLYSKGAAFYLKLIHELFDMEEDTVWDRVSEKRSLRLSHEARERFYAQSRPAQDDAS